MKYASIFPILATSLIASSSAMADDLDAACGSYRSNLASQRERCSNIKLQLDRSTCQKENVSPAEQAYAACIRSFNERGAKKTIEKSEQSKKQKPQP